MLTPKQIDELADKLLIPHYELVNPLTGEKSKWYLFDEVVDWLNKYFIKRDFVEPSEFIFLHFNPIEFRIIPSDVVPAALCMIKYLYRLPKERIHTPPGVYFLCDSDRIVYIGKSLNIQDRIVEHKKDLDKVFNSVYFLCCHIAQLLKVEEACIKYFQPELNKQYSQSDLNEADQKILNTILSRPFVAM